MPNSVLLEIYKYLFSSIDKGILILDKNEKIIDINKVAKNIYSLKEDEIKEILGKSIYEEKDKLKIEKIPEKNTKRIKIHNKWYKIKCTKIIKDKEEIGKALFIHEDTLQKSFEEEKIDKSKISYLANVSHEIRTPLTGILGAVELLANTHLSSIQIHYLNMLSSASKTLYQLINNILDIEKIEAGKVKLEKEEIDLKTFIYNILEVIYLKTVKKDIEILFYIDPEVPRYIVGDSTHISQILLNFLGNSVKFTEQGNITLEALKEKVKNDIITLKFKIQDTGMGIQEDKIPILFDKYAQVDPTIAKKFKGTGLGLAIAKKLITMMNGKIYVKSKLGKGSIFTFTIDVGLSPRRESIGSEFTSPLDNLHPLIVSKDQFMVKFLKKVLKQWRVNEIASNTAENLEIIDIYKYNTIIYDIKDHDLNSEYKTKIIQEIEKFKKFNLIILLSLNGLNTIEKDITIDKYILKPIKYSDLYAKLIIYKFIK